MEFQRAAAACMLLYPSIPILFMGEEFCSPSPFLFFVDFHDSRLRKSIEKYRRLEYPDHDWSQSLSPVDDRAFWASQRGDRDQGDQVTWHWYQSLLQVRRAWQAEGLLCGERKPNVHYDPAHGLFVLQYCSEGTAIGYVAVRIGGASTREEMILNLAESPLLDSHATPFESVSFPPGTQVIRRIAENQAIVGRGAIAWTSPDR